jgi:two-component system cell cycle sensor histidine kinase/response regulator CckA
MTRGPTFDDIFAVMSQASLGDAVARVALPDPPDLTDTPTRFAIALNVLLDDLAYRQRQHEQAEEKLYQAQKMEAVGQLAGGVAHDFNNLLSVILGYADLLLADGGLDQAAQADLVEIRRAGERARELTQQLLAFGRRQLLEPKPLDLNVVVSGMEKMLRRLLGESIELELLLAEELATTKADPGQLELVVMNLAINARDAMPAGGKLSVTTANVELDASYAAEHPEVISGPYVLLAVSDTGVGMPPEVRERIFEPFFTTKEQGRGTGLGLSSVFGFVRQSGGHIGVYSEPELGTTFKIYLPRGVTSSVPASAEAPGPRALRGFETVLLVEDQEQVRSLARLVLTRHGYTVLDAPDPLEALLIAERHPATIHLLLTDVVMPRMDGRRLSERLSAARPNLCVLFMSGYAGGTLIQDGALASKVGFLQKPFTPERLLVAVRALLDPR